MEYRLASARRALLHHASVQNPHGFSSLHLVAACRIHLRRTFNSLPRSPAVGRRPHHHPTLLGRGLSVPATFSSRSDLPDVRALHGYELPHSPPPVDGPLVTQTASTLPPCSAGCRCVSRLRHFDSLAPPAGCCRFRVVLVRAGRWGGRWPKLTSIDDESDFAQRRRQLESRIEEALAELDVGQRDRVRTAVALAFRRGVSLQAMHDLSEPVDRNAHHLFHVLELAEGDGMTDAQIEELALLIEERLFVPGLSG